MKRFLLALLAALTLAAICTQPAYAYDIASEQAEAFGTAALESALPAQTYDAFGTLTVADAAHPRPLLQKLWGYVLHEGGGALASAARNAALLLAVVFLAALCASLSASGACAKVTQMTGAVAVAALSVTHVTSCITAGSSALTTLRDFSKILLPSMCAAAAASGAATSAAAKYAATSLFLDVLLSAETAVLLPMLYTYAGTVICGAALEQDVLTALSALLLTADCMHFTQTRIATIDSFPVLFMMVMFLFMARWMQMSFYHQKLWKTLVPLFFSGVFMGLAIASKWIGCYGAVGLAVLFFSRFITLYKQSVYAKRYRNEDPAFARAADSFVQNGAATLAACVVFFVIVPLAIYCLSYIPYLSAYGEVKLNLKTFERIWNAQVTMFEYHKNLVATHYFSSPWYE